MLIREWMTRDVFTVDPDSSMMKAARLMKDKNVSRLPVVDESGRLLGIISDRDIKEASPSKATTLDMHELYYLLSELKVKDIMTKNPFCMREDESIEGAAVMMADKNFGGMPIVDAGNKVVGIITDSDIFKVLIEITGAKSGGSQLAFELSADSSSIKGILTTLRELDARIVSVLTSDNQASNTRRVYVRLYPLPAEQEKHVLETIKSKFPLLYVEQGIATQSAGC